MTLGGKIMLKKIATFFVVWAIVIFVYLLVFSIIERLKWKTTRKVVITVDDNELLNLKELIKLYPSNVRIFYGVLEYEDFILYVNQTFGANISKIYMTPANYRRVVYSLIDDGTGAWIDWLKSKIKQKKINLETEKVLFRINEQDRGEIVEFK